ncbi:MAG: hypothetical protein ABGX43_06510 [Nitrospinaceae bacterium]
MINIYTKRRQEKLLVLYALDEIGHDCSKMQAIRFIGRHQLLDINNDDEVPYKSKEFDPYPECRWETDMAYARKDLVGDGFMENHALRDHWCISLRGKQLLDKVKRLSTHKHYDVRQCYRWTSKCKKIFDPSYNPSSADTARPGEEVYDV